MEQGRGTWRVRVKDRERYKGMKKGRRKKKKGE